MRKLVRVTEAHGDKPICDASALFRDATAFAGAREDLSSLCKKLGSCNLVVSPDGLGLVLGATMATTQGSGFVPAMKLDALPTDKVHLVKCVRDNGRTEFLGLPEQAIKPGQRVLIVDDILASGSTTLALARAVEELGGEVVGIVFLVEMTARRGRALLEMNKYAVRSVLRFGN